MDFPAEIIVHIRGHLSVRIILNCTLVFHSHVNGYNETEISKVCRRLHGVIRQSQQLEYLIELEVDDLTTRRFVNV